MPSSILNTANCNVSGNNGMVGCNIIPTKIAYVAAVSKGTVIPATALTDVDTFLAYLEAAFNAADTRSERMWLSPQLTGFDNKTAEPVMVDRDGMSYLAQEKPFHWKWTLNTPNQNFCDYKKWRNLVHLSSLYDYFILDDAGQFWYTSATDADGDAGAAGFTSSQVIVGQWSPKKAEGLNEYPFSIQFMYNDELIENLGFIECGAFPTDKWGLIDVTLTLGATTPWTTTAAYVGGGIGCGGGTSLGATYGDTIAAAGAWVIYNRTDAASVTPLTVTYMPVTDEYAFTFAAQTAADVLAFTLAAPSVLNITPYFVNLITETPLVNAIP